MVIVLISTNIDTLYHSYSLIGPSWQSVINHKVEINKAP